MQKEIFLSGEGDAWIDRNRINMDKRDWQKNDILFQDVSALNLPKGSKILEIGCSQGSRLACWQELKEWQCYGIDPSSKAIALANAKGLQTVQGTADKLPWDNNYFDAVIFGFCLYLCDRNDLFKIAAEANRVLKNPGWLAILDFYAKNMSQNAYSHHANVQSFKMDYRTMFEWHPAYTCYSHKVVDHADINFTDERNDWMSVSILRKKE